jgi:nucleotide-binding universal stress UspA family protein/uncharacterized protein YrrD
VFNRVIVPLDGSTVAEKALEYGPEVAKRFNAHLVLLQAYAGERQSMRTIAMMPAEPVAAPVDPRTIEMLEETARLAEQEGRTYLDGKARELAATGLSVDTVLVDEEADDAIVNEANREPGALVVMCTHGRGGLERLVFGSTAREVLQRVQTPILLIRVYESADLESGGSRPMDISIGSDVVGTTGKLGEVHRVIVDARTDRITDIVVKHGFLFGRERVVPLSHVTGVESGVIHVDLDERGFEALDGFTDDRYHAPGPNYAGPPGYSQGDFLMDATVAEGPMQGMTGAPATPLGFPSGEQVSPDDMSRPAVSSGTPVLDSEGHEVGHVHDMDFAADTGAPTRLVLRTGRIFRHETEIPVSMIQDISDDGVMLNVTRAQVEQLVEKR